MSRLFPDKLKLAKVVPIHKKDSTKNCNNYRSISLLSVFSETFEKSCIPNYINFLTKKVSYIRTSLISEKNHSTELAVITITEEIKRSIDDGNFAFGIFLDLKKAFDTVNHSILIRKLEHHEIRSAILEWFKSYLTSRKQFVCVNGHCSEIFNIA